MLKGFASVVKPNPPQIIKKLISIDGKTARGSYDREEGLKALHTVSAWEARTSSGLGSASGRKPIK